MEGTQGGGMRINWVLANSFVLPPNTDVNRLKDIGSFWGSWRTWRSCSTDNVICNEPGEARDLLKRKMNEMCNLYIPESAYVELERPRAVRMYGGQFTFEVDNRDELIALQLAASQSDIVLLLGFDWTKKRASTDRLIKHKTNNYRKFVVDAVRNNPDVQWVLVDHPAKIMPELAKFENLMQDTLENVIELMNN